MGITYQKIRDRILIVSGVENTQDEDGNYLMVHWQNYGDTVDICAPGDIIYSTVTEAEGLYDYYSGTSMAAPMVTGSAAVVWGLKPELTAKEVKDILLNNYEVMAFYEKDGETYTYPMLNVGAAVESILK